MMNLFQGKEAFTTVKATTMTMTVFQAGNIFRCPVCHEPLIEKDRTLSCEKRHSFDIARQGHVNLLRTSKSAHGDNKQMVLSRRAFLEKGFYSHLRDAVAETVFGYLPDGGVLLDSGCGEGYYTEALVAKKDLAVFGIDISSAAASLAARKNGIRGVAVASAYDLPVTSDSCHAVTNIFAPFCREEFARVLKKDGYLFNIIPAEKHLWELKSAIYDTPYENSLATLEVEGFSFVEKIGVTRKVTLSSREDIAALLMMTPYFYRTGKDGLARAEALDELSLTAAFYILVYRKL